MTGSGSSSATNEPEEGLDADGGRTGNDRVCRDTGREEGLIGKYDIWLCRQSFREMARDMGFRKYD